MSNYVFECFCSLCYIKCEERFHDDDRHDALGYLTYEFTGSKDIYNGFADGEMRCTDHIDYFLLYLMDDDRVVRKSMKTYLDVVICTDLSKGYRAILLSCLSVSTYLRVLHYQSFLGTSQFTPTTIFYLVMSHPQPFYTLNHYTLLAILFTQLFYTVSHFTTKLFYPLGHFYTFMSSHCFFLFLQISMLLREDDK
jgi:hypothetical protein